MAQHFGYADKTALLKSLVRLCALIGRNGIAHTIALPMSHEPPAVQDKIDKELLRMWNANETVDAAYLGRVAVNAAAEAGIEPQALLARAGQELIARVRSQEAAE